MNDKDMTLDTFRSLIFEGTSYTITDEEIEEFWEALAEMIEHNAISEENEGPCPTYYL